MANSTNSHGEDNKYLTILSMVVARAWKDAAYLNNLKTNPKVALEQEGLSFPAGTQFTVVENTNTVRYVPLSRDLDPKKDATHLHRLIGHLLPIAQGTEIRLVQSSENHRYIVIPVLPASVSASATSEGDLRSMAAMDSTTTTVTVQTAVQTTSVVTTAEATETVVAVTTVVLT